MKTSSGSVCRKQIGSALGYVLALVGLAGVISAAGYQMLNTSLSGSVRVSSSLTNAEVLQHVVNTLASEAAADSDGLPLAPAGTVTISGLTGSESPAGGWQVPAASKASKTDAFGNYLGYCAWNHGSSNAGSGYFQGVAANLASTYIAVISPGRDKVFQTNCTNAKSGIANGDDAVRFITLGAGQQIRNGAVSWLDPVDCFDSASPATDVLGNAANCGASTSRIDLISTTGLANGTMVLAKKAGVIYQLYGGTWQQVGGASGGYNSAGFSAATFTPINGANPNTVLESNTVQTSGIGTAILVTVANGAYAISSDNVTWGSWQTGPGQISNGQYIKLQQTSSSAYSTTTTTTISLGGVTKTWNVTTRAAITTPNAFSFNEVTGASVNTAYASNTVTISGIEAPVSLSATGNAASQQCNVNGAGWSACSGTVTSGVTLQVRQVSSGTVNVKTDMTVTVGGRSATFSVTTSSTMIEDVFSTYLFDGNSTARSISSGIDLVGKGGMVWIKNRTFGDFATTHRMFDTARGMTFAGASALVTNSAEGQGSSSSDTIKATSTGFEFGTSGISASLNNSSYKYSAWSFRKAAKFVDVLTWLGDGSPNRSIQHNLGITPGMIIVKRTTGIGNWVTYHRGLTPNNIVLLNTPDSQYSGVVGGYSRINSPTPTSFNVHGDGTYDTNHDLNISGSSYVAYVFAHDTAADGIIQCGVFTTTSGIATTVPLGWEPQYLLIKRIDTADNWTVVDSMRGFNASPTSAARLTPNTSDAEFASAYPVHPTATGFVTGTSLPNSATYIYLAIRRGPMRQPTNGAQVFNAITRLGTGTTAQITGVGFTPDIVLPVNRSGDLTTILDRLRGTARMLGINATYSESDLGGGTGLSSFDMDGVTVTTAGSTINGSSVPYVNYFLKRHPGVIEQVFYTGNATANRSVSHNLQSVPELLIVKSRTTGTAHWVVYHKDLGLSKYLRLNTAEAVNTYPSFWGTSNPTATDFRVSEVDDPNKNGDSITAYLFASLPGVSKVGTYVGSASDVNVDAGFSGSPRLLLVKRIDSPGNWVTFDSTRGISNGGADPALKLNAMTSEVNGANFVEPTVSGFIAKAGNADVNANGGTYMFLAIR